MDIEHYGPHLKMGDKLGAHHYRGSMVVSFTLNPIKIRCLLYLCLIV